MSATQTQGVNTALKVEGCAVVAQRFDMSDQNRKEALERLMGYPLPFVEYRLLNENRIPAEKVPEAILEWRKFMATILVSDGPVGMVSPTIDEVWHACILFTAEYRDLCMNVFGQFVGHAPNWPGSPTSAGGGERFVSAYNSLFGELPDIWDFSDQNCKDDVGSCNMEPCKACSGQLPGTGGSS